MLDTSQAEVKLLRQQSEGSELAKKQIKVRTYIHIYSTVQITTVQYSTLTSTTLHNTTIQYNIHTEVYVLYSLQYSIIYIQRYTLFTTVQYNIRTYEGIFYTVH